MVGIGNEYRADDAVGIKVLDRLAGRMAPEHGRDVGLVKLAGDQSYILDLMNSTDVLIIVDSVRSQASPGTIFRIEPAQLPIPKGLTFSSTHGYDPSYLVEMARAMKTLPDTVIIYAIVGRSFGYATTLTPEVEESIDIVVNRIADEIEEVLSPVSNSR